MKKNLKSICLYIAIDSFLLSSYSAALKIYYGRQNVCKYYSHFICRFCFNPKIYISHISNFSILCYCSKVQTILQELHCINYIYSSIQMQEIKSCGGILHISFLHLQKKWASKKFLEKT